jgi:hypothetical protein
MENKRTTQRINETKSWFFKKINKIDNPLAKLTQRKREVTKTNRIKEWSGDITTHIKKSREASGNTLKTY